jgi:hypothetical protein
MNKTSFALQIFFVVLIGLFLANFVLADKIEIPNPLGKKDIKGVITGILKEVLKVIWAGGFLMLVIAGIIFIYSGGNPEGVNKAKKCLIYAILGIIIATLGQDLANYLGGEFGKAGTSLSAIFQGLAKSIRNLAGVSAAIMGGVAGILFLLSGGSPETISHAKKMFIYAIIGLVVALLAEGLSTQLYNKGG